MALVAYLFLLSLSAWHSSLHPYRFVCNGILADGHERSDECGICDVEHAARWRDPNLAVTVDDRFLPKGISVDDWDQIVQNSFAAWNEVSGSRLRLSREAKIGQREFGANEGSHEIFWITEKEDWRRLVGTGEFGTLGATLPRYTCGGREGSYRSIFDADLVLNGLSHINWQIDCQNEDCISVQTTLVHELGHFFGLDHSCLMCNTSVMSARAVFDFTHPLFDDIEGIRALYPNIDGGGFGYSCHGDEDCDEAYHCISDGLNRYCSNSCKSDDNCELGASCLSKEKGNICAFANSKMTGMRSEGENCLYGLCADPLVCAGVGVPNYYCFTPCHEESGCHPDQRCVMLANEKQGVCVRVQRVGNACNHRELCDDGLYCVFEGLSGGYCRTPCDREQGCPAGFGCENIEPSIGVCLPLELGLNLGVGLDHFDSNKRRFDRELSAKIDNGASGAGCSAPSSATSMNSWWIFILLLGMRRCFCRLKLW